MSRRGRDRHKKSINDGIRVICIHGCGKTFTPSSDNKQLHERTCDYNPNGVRIGGGLPQQFYSSTDRTEKMEKVETAYGENFALYRKCINSNINVLNGLHHAILNDWRGVVRRERDNVKFYIVGTFVFEKVSRSGVFTDPPIHLKTKPIATTVDPSKRHSSKAIRI